MQAINPAVKKDVFTQHVLSLLCAIAASVSQSMALGLQPNAAPGTGRIRPQTAELESLMVIICIFISSQVILMHYNFTAPDILRKPNF